jgi:hypothetical protein
VRALIKFFNYDKSTALSASSSQDDLIFRIF